MSDSQKVLEKLCSLLNLNYGNGLVTSKTEGSIRQSQLFSYIKDKTGIDAAFFMRSTTGNSSIPLIYFHRLESYNKETVAKIHQLAWNLGEAPLLFIVMPNQVLVYNAYVPPQKVNGELDVESGLIESLKIYSDLESERKKVLAYHRMYIESGEYWQVNRDRFNVKFRVDKTLLDNLKLMREHLLNKGLSPEVAHSLLGRAIFIKYLEDRKDKNGIGAFPNGFFSTFLSGAKCFTDVLTDIGATYSLFDFLYDKFNGDIFPVNETELKQVDQEHLTLLYSFITGKSEMSTGQLALWPLYTFDVIPIQLISDIYEQFFHFEVDNENSETGKKFNSNKQGTHYTPFYLVEFLLDEVLPWEGEYRPIKILDPACGSGIFLVEAYRRLVTRWKQSFNKVPNASDLKTILVQNIFGVDSNPEAIRVASFSLCLALCDYLEPRSIWNKVKFPLLRNKNLFVSDFFSEKTKFIKNKYDLIIGNPPWVSNLSHYAKSYIQNNDKIVGNEQIAQAFLWHAPELCKVDGEICLLVTSRGLLFNTSTTNQRFRRKFLSEYHVKTIINFSALRKSLFQKAVGPACAVVFSPKKPNSSLPIVYCCPKPTHTLQDSKQITIEPYDISSLSRKEACSNDLIWKVAMWGGPRDYQLIKRLYELPSLQDICEENNFVNGEGFIIGDGKYYVPEMANKSFINIKQMERYLIDETKLPQLNQTNFIRPRSDKKEIFIGPHLLIKQSPVAGVGFIAAVVRCDAVFNQSILGIHGNEEDISLLSLCCIALNSKLPIYLAMMTSSRWLVERDELEANEILNLRIPFDLDNQECIQMLGDMSLESVKNDENLAEHMMRSVYLLDDSESKLIKDAIEITLDYFRFGKNSRVINPPSSEMVELYLETLARTLNNAFSSNNRFKLTIFAGQAPLKVVSLTLNKEQNDCEYGINIIESTDLLIETLHRLDTNLLEQRSQGVFIRRNVRVYEKDTIFIIKPNQIRYWSQSLALRDADELYADIMDTWGCQ